MSVNYYLLVKKPHLTDQEASDMKKAYEHIYSVLMTEVKSENPFVQEWASEKLHALEFGHLKQGPYNQVHIGKSKYGERFTFSSLHSSWDEWKSYILANGSEIVNEYGDKIDLDQLEKSINESIKCPINHPKMTLSQDGYYLVKGNFT